MPYCPNNHGPKNGRFCDECGAETIAVAPATPPPATGDKLNIRSPEAHANAHSHIYMPGAVPAARLTFVKCPQCGHRNPEHETFDCMGECRRENLCRRHFDETYEVCVRCARKLRKSDEQEQGRWVALEAERDQWQGRAEKAEEALAGLQASSRATRKQVEQSQYATSLALAKIHELETDLAKWQVRAEKAENDLAGFKTSSRATQKQLEQSQKVANQAHAKVQGLETDLVDWQVRTEKAEKELTGLKPSSRATKKQLEQSQKDLSQAWAQVQALENDLAQWRKRAETAEAKLAEIERKKREDKEDRRRKEAEKKKSPIWQQIGIKMINIPAGDFLYGDDKKKVYMDDNCLAKTPVTNVQYRAFVAATDHRKPSHWKNGKIPNDKENDPVTYVSWHDAVAFCQWIGLRLPTEQEWEKGARGAHGRRYPWGDAEPIASLCNFNKYVGDTTPVDRYSGGASPYGLLDMSGNVLEWCEDWFDNDHNYRVLRGGSWYFNQYNVRSMFRLDLSPVNRDGGSGFRCASS